jgi:peptidoglycan/LPS O-acetylase OafA/YrhL
MLPMSQTATGKENSGRDNNFDFIRLVLAVQVIFSHSYPLLWGDNAREPLMRLTGGQVTFGETAVAGFFILSGFLITKSWVRSSGPGDYLRKRVLRIYPGFLAAVAFCGLVVGPLGAANLAEYWGAFSPSQFVVKALNLQGAAIPPSFQSNPGHAINGSLWSIRYEFLCYLGVAALGLCGAFRQRRLVLAAFAGWFAVYALQVQLDMKIPGHRLGWIYGFPPYWPRLATCFLAGALFYLYRDRMRYSLTGFVASVIGLVALAALPALEGLALATPLLGAYAFFYLGFLPVRRLHGFAKRGDLSYGMYLYAFPVQQLLVHYVGTSLHPLVLFAVATPITTTFAVLSWFFVEKPFIRLKAAPPVAANLAVAAETTA